MFGGFLRIFEDDDFRMTSGGSAGRNSQNVDCTVIFEYTLCFPLPAAAQVEILKMSTVHSFYLSNVMALYLFYMVNATIYIRCTWLI